MTSPRYDIVIFAATGFTGQFVAEEVARVAEEESLTWAVSGRSIEKLQKFLEKASKKTGKALESIPIIVTDVSNEESLLEMAKQSKVVLNCVGPYCFYGEQVVKACIEGGANHLDISGEKLYMEKIQLLYNERAREEGVHIVSACGSGSIIAEAGVFHAKSKFDGQINGIKSYLEIFTGPEGISFNNGTLKSTIHGYLDARQLKGIRKSLFPEPLPPAKFSLPKNSTVFRSDITSKWAVEYPGCDESVVNRTQRHNYTIKNEKPVQYQQYFCIANFINLMGILIFGIILGILSKFSWTRYLFLKYSSLLTFGLFKPTGPTPNQIEKTSFTMTFVSKGWKSKNESEQQSAPDTVKITKVTGPELGYVTAPICMVQAAIVVLKEKDKLPEKGGVFPPGAAFQDTSLIERLSKNNILFQEVDG